MLAGLRLLWHRWTTRRKMDRVFSRGRDPYRYAQSEYERARLAGMEEALSRAKDGPAPYRNALEIGAAEGAFTLRLAGLAERVTALDISPVALGRAAEAVKGFPRARLVQADVRFWEPAGELFDAVVCGDVLYYLDKPLVRDEFERAFVRLAAWLEPKGTLLLAHGFVGDAERAIRRGYRERFQALGLELVSETVVDGRRPGDASCLLSVLRKP